ncbi:MAG: FAD:protein transferase [Actinomycetota bacterium]
MGMAVSFDIREPLPAAGALDDAVRWLHDVDARFSTYRRDSQISRLGRGEIALTDVDDDVRFVLRTCLDLNAITEGAFDAFGLTERHGSTLDPSGFVKGWATERAADILEGAGARNFCVNAGGDIVLRGTPMALRAWRVGIRHPSRPARLATTLELRGPDSVATSATYERGAHIIDPAAQRPTTQVAAATVIGPDLGIADAYATAMFIMGLPGLDWIEAQPGYDAFLITRSRRTHWSSDFDRSRRRNRDDVRT